MTIGELYGKVLADDELKASLAEAAKAGKVEEWAAAQGVEATQEELVAYVRAAAVESGELSEDELDKVAGGGYITGINSVYYKIISIGMTGDGCWED